MSQIINVNDNTDRVVLIGRQGENYVTQLIFDFTEWYNLLGEGILSLTLLRPKETIPYPIELTINDTFATWNISAMDTALTGVGKAQLVYIIDNQIKKSTIYTIRVLASLDDGTEVPDPYDSWLTNLQQIAYGVKENAEQSEQYEEQSKQYANQSKQYAEQAGLAFTFTDTGDGNILIVRGGN